MQATMRWERCCYKSSWTTINGTQWRTEAKHSMGRNETMTCTIENSCPLSGQYSTVLRTLPGSITSLVPHHVPVPTQTALDLSVPFRSCSAMMSLRCHHCSATFHRCSICFLFRALLPTVAPQRHHRFALVWFSASVYKSLWLAHVTPDLFWLNHQLNLLFSLSFATPG